eukprot:15484048-Alexandrium_andersonii.AAC.1
MKALPSSIPWFLAKARPLKVIKRASRATQTRIGSALPQSCGSATTETYRLRWCMVMGESVGTFAQ